MRGGTQGALRFCLLNDPSSAPPPFPPLPRAVASCRRPSTPRKSFLISGTVAPLGQWKGISQTIDPRINILLFSQMPHLTAIVYISTPQNSIESKTEPSGPLIMFYALSTWMPLLPTLPPSAHSSSFQMVSTPRPHAEMILDGRQCICTSHTSAKQSAERSIYFLYAERLK